MENGCLIETKNIKLFNRRQRLKQKKAKDTKKSFIKKIEGYKHCSEATQLQNKINQLEKIEFVGI